MAWMRPLSFLGFLIVFWSLYLAATWLRPRFARKRYRVLCRHHAKKATKGQLVAIMGFERCEICTKQRKGLGL